MAKKILGIEIGNCRLKIAICSDYNLERLITADLPDNLVQEDEIVSWEAMAEFIKEVIKENKISVKKCGSRNTRKTSLYQTRGHAGYDGRPIKSQPAL